MRVIAKANQLLENALIDNCIDYFILEQQDYLFKVDQLPDEVKDALQLSEYIIED
jgi:hypothetical protein